MKFKNFVLKMIKPDAERIIRSPYSPYEEDGGVLFHKTGGIFKKMEFKRGAPDGPWFQYHPNGQIQYEGFFKNGKPEGSITMYYDNGQVFRRGEYKNGLKEGPWSIYDKKGNMLDEVTFKLGRAV